ncbi:Chaperone ClpC1, chloroplastic -like protein [Gossypium arboreum]|uniref:Chaperone ClpC1, chloroplastic-like protein n=1 Tax=Gossypium arboreum TaxID=29729 RepID=A0A0B0NNQ1_GOSAR|nr:Chaperone ClpC1, chloroplastic -like protein [Gossypium arboreum]
MGINLKDTRVEVEKIVGRGRGVVTSENLYTPRAKRAFELSMEESLQLGHKYIGPEHLLLGLLREIEGVAARVLENLGADLSKIRKKVIRKIAESEARFASRRAASGKKMSMVALEEYGTNLTKLAEEGKLVPVVGRQDQIERVMQILGRRTKNNPCLIGEPGVGKTAIAEGLAQRIASGDIPETIEGKIAHPNWSRRCRGAIDAANILKPALARSEFQCIGATTLDEYRKHMEEDPALERRFQPVKVPEPSVEETLQILEGLRECYEIHHKLRYTDEALISAAHLSFQYLNDRFLPDKAIDLIDEAGSRVRRHHAQLPEEAKDLEKELWQLTKSKNEAVRDQDFEKARELRDREITLRAQITATQEKEKEMNKGVEKGVEGSLVVTEADIQYIVSSWTGIPVEKVSIDESD